MLMQRPELIKFFRIFNVDFPIKLAEIVKNSIKDCSFSIETKYLDANLSVFSIPSR